MVSVGKYAGYEFLDGLARAFLVGEEFIGEDDVCLFLGGNFLWARVAHKTSQCMCSDSGSNCCQLFR